MLPVDASHNAADGCQDDGNGDLEPVGELLAFQLANVFEHFGEQPADAAECHNSQERHLGTPGVVVDHGGHPNPELRRVR